MQNYKTKLVFRWKKNKHFCLEIALTYRVVQHLTLATIYIYIYCKNTIKPSKQPYEAAQANH